MSIPLSKKTLKILNILPVGTDRDKLAARLQEEISDNIPAWNHYTPEGLERIRFSVIRLICEQPESEETVFATARTDWRDLLMSAGFGQSPLEHEKWYKEQTKNRS